MILNITSAEANKMLKKLADDRNTLFCIERDSARYHAAVGEDPATLKPEYDFFQTREAIARINEKELIIKHALNKFNAETIVGDTGLTIDQCLVRLPQLNIELNTMKLMKKYHKKERAGIQGNVIDYVYTSYDPDDAAEEYDNIQTLINHIQLELDKVNTSVQFRVDI